MTKLHRRCMDSCSCVYFLNVVDIFLRVLVDHKKEGIIVLHE